MEGRDPEPRPQQAGDGGTLRLARGRFCVGRWGWRGSSERLQQGKEGPPPQLAADRGRQVRDLGSPQAAPQPPPCQLRDPGLGAWTPRPAGSVPAPPAPSCPLQLWLPAVTGPWGLSCPLWGRGSPVLFPRPGCPLQSQTRSQPPSPAAGCSRKQEAKAGPRSLPGLPCPRPRLPVDSGWAGAPGL